jgi:hypothetical protein
MTVHINEVHTDIRPAGPADAEQSGSAGSAGRTVDERWRESRGRRRWLEERTSAYGHED